MNKVLRQYHWINALIVLSILFAALRYLHVLPYIHKIPMPVFLIAVLAGIWIKRDMSNVHPEVKDPLLQQQPSKGFFYIGLGILMIGVMNRIMHWPWSSLMLLVSMALILIAWILSFVNSTKDVYEDEILDGSI